MSADDELTPAEIAFRRVMGDRNRTRWREWATLTLRRWRAANPNIRPDPWCLARGKRKVVKVPEH